MAQNTFRCYAYRAAEGYYVADCLDLTLLGEGQSMEEAISELREAILCHLEAARDSGWEQDLIPRRAPLYRWLEFYKRFFLYALRVLFTGRFGDFQTWMERPTADQFAYA
ncbi:MAG TPA: type II toxin-antitoxin system HicB family antitoxin [Anaerolineae bacterium]|nr:type II toxin-antitoxin system HicB family antitoxin [Anaerolineae bacterium]